MSGDSRDYSLDVSEYLFRLTTESLRLLSNDTNSYQSITSLVEKLAGPTAADALAQHDIETLRQHLSKIPTGGPIRIHLQIAKTSADNLFEAKRRLGEALGTDLTVVSCPLLSGPSTITVWTKEGTTNACEEAQARGDYREAT